MVGDRGAVRRSENMGFEAIGNVRWRMKQPVGRGHLTTPKLWDIWKSGIYNMPCPTVGDGVLDVPQVPWTKLYLTHHKNKNAAHALPKSCVLRKNIFYLLPRRA